jgi:hypothetical protein
MAAHAFTDAIICSIDQQNQNGTGLVRFESLAEFALEFSDVVQTSGNVGPLQSRLGWMLGYRQAAYAAALLHVSEAIMNVLACRYAYMEVVDYNKSVSDLYVAAFSQSIMSGDILARVSLSEGVLSYKTNDAIGLVASKRQYFGGVNIQTLQVRLLDEYGRVLALNGSDYSFVLAMEVLHDL